MGDLSCVGLGGQGDPPIPGKKTRVGMVSGSVLGIQRGPVSCCYKNKPDICKISMPPPACEMIGVQGFSRPPFQDAMCHESFFQVFSCLHVSHEKGKQKASNTDKSPCGAQQSLLVQASFDKNKHFARSLSLNKKIRKVSNFIWSISLIRCMKTKT